MEAEPSPQQSLEALVDDLYDRSDKLIIAALSKYLTKNCNENPEPMVQ